MKWILILAFLVSGCDAVQKIQEPPVDSNIERAQKAIVGNLIDPDSAMFREMLVAYDGEIVCGEINAKNRMGGYTGYTAFLVRKSSGEIVFPSKWEGQYNGVLRGMMMEAFVLTCKGQVPADDVPNMPIWGTIQE